MKYIKAYESIENEPQVGDYVMCYHKGTEPTQISDFLANNIGQISKIVDEYPPLYYVHYENIPDKLKFRDNNQSGLFSQEPFRRINIIVCAKTKE